MLVLMLLFLVRVQNENELKEIKWKMVGGNAKETKNVEWKMEKFKIAPIMHIVFLGE